MPISINLFEIPKSIKLKCTVHLCNRVYKVADLAKMADTQGVNMKNSLFKKINEKGV